MDQLLIETLIYTSWGIILGGFMISLIDIVYDHMPFSIYWPTFVVLDRIKKKNKTKNKTWIRNLNYRQVFHQWKIYPHMSVQTVPTQRGIDILFWRDSLSNFETLISSVDLRAFHHMEISGMLCLIDEQCYCLVLRSSNKFGKYFSKIVL